MAKRRNTISANTLAYLFLICCTIAVGVALYLIASGKNFQIDAGAFSGRFMACPNVASPVCSTNGKTFSNSCFARQAKAQIDCIGSCPCINSIDIYQE